MKFIFADIDGCLNTRSYRENPATDYYSNPISDFNMCYLKYLVSATGAEIVLTSTWRHYWNEGTEQTDEAGEYLNLIFAKHGLRIYGKTPDFKEDRRAEIEYFLKKHPAKGYVILDDIDFGFEEGFIRTDDETGFDEVACEKAICMLNENIDDKY